VLDTYLAELRGTFSYLQPVIDQYVEQYFPRLPAAKAQRVVELYPKAIDRARYGYEEKVRVSPWEIPPDEYLRRLDEFVEWVEFRRYLQHLHRVVSENLRRFPKDVLLEDPRRYSVLLKGLPVEIVEDLAGRGVPVMDETRVPDVYRGLARGVTAVGNPVGTPGTPAATPNPTGPPGAGELGRGERRALWKLARSVVDEALRAAGLRYVGEMRVDGMAPEPYSRFLLAIRDKVSELLKEPRRLEFKVQTYLKGFADTDVYVDGEYLYTWRPVEPYVGAFQNWVHRVYNLLRTLAERGLLKDEVLAKLREGDPDRGSALDRVLREVLKEYPEVTPCRSS
jgi:hypothetical protein